MVQHRKFKGNMEPLSSFSPITEAKEAYGQACNAKSTWMLNGLFVQYSFKECQQIPIDLNSEVCSILDI